ncbi:MAG: tRNA (adenosine(37)-N6)-dimethylallyltransferase MiaA [Limosilactobacillus sp.]|jgi:tRNA dimethylallyltransferase|uniref:tRNA (adenosine(37)-N6)-dimethylallyltransferase MiaA n=1 Tax=Limosilactobacillus sp. TaxID=2773925 RepID=UPI0025BED7A4|nr:tRNA (adenosine(37)-N6)-dimethylallyltransferase MiaA [Limosilactobacillus sp.]MCI1975494.1 tRNA (adenosine(37)-N6)-dimethylallyltransferase MiaA [Limosilactobacillus sp.]MCI2031593.1 tRNA (adenosine(37)-N6)-dimethylallyltransferase MiaA [Limosilactobacillus sp.]
MSKVVAIVGPTAVGKTSLSIKLATALNGEIISGDSMQVYRHLDIGTAKVTPEEMAGIPHHLIDICDVDEQYSVAKFKNEANSWIQKISSAHQLPLIVGGTGFYLQSLTNNLALGGNQDNQRSEKFRQHWQQVLEERGPHYVWEQLESKDPKAASAIPENNSRRVIRALEVIDENGQLFSQQQQSQAMDDFLLIGLTTDRQVLYDRINRRVDIMIDSGLLEEAKWLYDKGGIDLPAGKGIGYHELFPYFAGKCSLEDAVAKIKQDSRHYAKRQLTWFRNKMDVHWFDLVSGQNNTNEIKEFIDGWLKK